MKTLLHDLWSGVVNNTLFTIFVCFGFAVNLNWHFEDNHRDAVMSQNMAIEQSGRIQLVKDIQRLEYERRQDRLDLYFDLGIYQHKQNMQFKKLNQRLNRAEGRIRKLNQDKVRVFKENAN